MRTVERAGLRFDVVDRGPEDAPAVVLLHGFPQSASSWDELGPRLNAAGYRTLAPDQRGYSRGARPRGRRAYRMSELVGDVLALLDAAGGAPVHLAGHDWGAVVAWTVAARHPERLRTLTALSVPHPAAFLRSLVSGRQAVLSWYMYVFQVPGLPELLLSPAHPRRRERLVRWLMASGQTEARARRDAERMAEPGALTAALNWYRAMLLADPRRIFAPVSVPTLFISSDADTAISARTSSLAARYAVGRYRHEVLRGVSHWIPEEAAGATAELILAHLSAHG